MLTSDNASMTWSKWCAMAERANMSREHLMFVLKCNAEIHPQAWVEYEVRMLCPIEWLCVELPSHPFNSFYVDGIKWVEDQLSNNVNGDSYAT